MATVNRWISEGSPAWFQNEAIERAHPPLPAAVLRELCERIEKGGKSKRSGRRSPSISDEQLLKYLPKEFKEIDIDSVRKMLMNIVRQLSLNCMDHCEDFGMPGASEFFCTKRKFCVNKSIMKVLGKILNAEIHPYLPKGKSKTRKRRVEICWDD